jgi:hypothetical protein
MTSRPSLPLRPGGTGNPPPARQPAIIHTRTISQAASQPTEDQQKRLHAPREGSGLVTVCDARIQGLLDRRPHQTLRECRIANVAKRIIMHGLAYSIEGLMTTMIAELACVISL